MISIDFIPIRGTRLHRLVLTIHDPRFAVKSNRPTGQKERFAPVKGSEINTSISAPVTDDPLMDQSIQRAVNPPGLDSTGAYTTPDWRDGNA